MSEATQVVLLGLLVLVLFFAVCLVFGYGIILQRRPNSRSPYSHLPLRYGSEISYDTAEKVLRFLYFMFQYDNQIFDLKHAAFCRETGRIFPNAVNWYDKIEVDWTFIQKRYPGKFVSWGSLTAEQQEIVRLSHDSLAGFQIEFSSPTPQPSGIEAKYALAKPGPLYVDVDTHVLLGWQSIPDTDLEVLIVQKPLHIINVNYT